LSKCVEEITYLLTPPAHPPPNLQPLGNSSSFINQGDGSLGLEDVYAQQRQKLGHQQPGTVFYQSSMPNHQPPPIPSMADTSSMSQVSLPPHSSAVMSREPSSQQPMMQNLASTSPSPAAELSNHHGEQQVGIELTAVPSDEPVEKVLHRLEVFGRPVTGREEEQQAFRQSGSEEPDAWTFDGGISDVEPGTEAVPRRPDLDAFPSANLIPSKSPPRSLSLTHNRRKSQPGSSAMSRRRSSEGHGTQDTSRHGSRSEPPNFRLRFALKGHLDVVRSVIFTGGGSPSEPEICTAGDDGMIKRWIIPAGYSNIHSNAGDIDIGSTFTHRGHEGVVTSLAACPAASNFATGGRVSGDGWIFSGGQDATVRVWERGRVDPKATIDGHTGEVWTVCVLPTTCASVFGQDCSNFGGPDRILLASGSTDGTVKIWAVSAPPQIMSPSTGSRRGVGGSRRHSVTSGSNHPSSPQPTVASDVPFDYMLVHTIERPNAPSPTCITPLSLSGSNFVVSYSDSSIVIFDTRTAEEMIGMASGETYDGTQATRVNTIVASALGSELSAESGRTIPEDESVVHGATGSLSEGGVEGIVISGHEDQYIRFFDANSGKYILIFP
jgi:striatin 1/3/4